MNTKKSTKKSASPHVWTSTTYFAEGFPYTIVNTIAEALFVDFGATAKGVGLTSLFHLPWNLKFLWAPFADHYGTKRQWMLSTQSVISVLLLVCALMIFLPQHSVLWLISFVFMLLAFASATQDISIDGYYLEELDKPQQAKFVGYRVAAYRVSQIAAGGVVLAIVGQTEKISGSQQVGWSTGFLFTALCMGGLWLFHRYQLPATEKAKLALRAIIQEFKKPKFAMIILAVVLFIVAFKLATGWLSNEVELFKKMSIADWIGLFLLFVLLSMLTMLKTIHRKLKKSDSFFAEAFVNFLDQKKVISILAFICLFRVGESFLLKMRYLFLYQEVGLTKAQIGLYTGVIGVVVSIAASIIGGMLIAKHGLKKWIWPFVIMQNTLNLLYMWVAYQNNLLPTGEQLSIIFIATIIAIESFGAGLGTSVFMVYIMRCCQTNYKAAHMALLTALMSIGFTLAGLASGFIVEMSNFTTYFGFTFLATIPGMLLIFFLPHLDKDPIEK